MEWNGMDGMRVRRKQHCLVLLKCRVDSERTAVSTSESWVALACLMVCSVSALLPGLVLICSDPPQHQTLTIPLQGCRRQSCGHRTVPAAGRSSRGLFGQMPSNAAALGSHQWPPRHHSGAARCILNLRTREPSCLLLARMSYQHAWAGWH